MQIRHANHGSRKAELQMTAMIDIVFMLLVFFIMTFTIVAPEGDFNVQMPTGRRAPPPSLLPITIRLRADDDGRLAAIVVGGQAPVKNNDFNLLRAQILDLVGHGTDASVAAETEVILDCDHQLRYEYVVDAITAVSGYVADDGKNVVRVIEKIRLAPLKELSG